MTWVKCIAKDDKGKECGNFWEAEGFLFNVRCPKCGAVDKIQKYTYFGYTLGK